MGGKILSHHPSLPNGADNFPDYSSKTTSALKFNEEFQSGKCCFPEAPKSRLQRAFECLEWGVFNNLLLNKDYVSANRRENELVRMLFSTFSLGVTSLAIAEIDKSAVMNVSRNCFIDPPFAGLIRQLKCGRQPNAYSCFDLCLEEQRKTISIY